MRKLRFGALAASAALASVTVLGAGTAMAQEGDGDPHTDTITSDGNYTMTATAIGECKVEFEFESLRGDTRANWRGDYRVGDEDPITQVEDVNPAYGNRGTTYRPVITNDEGTAEAIADRDNPYPFAAGTAIVDLAEARDVPDFESAAAAETRTLQGVGANENGEHTITFGVYQGPARYDSGAYDEVGEIIVTGCPVLTLPERISSELNLPDFSELSSNLSS